MGAAVAFRFDISSGLQGLERLEQRARDVAIPRALNRAAASSRTFMGRNMASDMTLKVSTVREQLKIANATMNRPVAQVSVTGARIPLYDFGARQTKRGVTARTGKSGRQLYPSAFIAKMRSGHIGVFKRTTKKRLPIVELHGASLPYIFAKYLPQGQAFAEDALAKNLAHEFRFALAQQGAAA